MYPAPKPLSMLTTDTPGAQLFSIARSAASPVEARPVTYTRRHSDNRRAHQSPNDRSESPFHPCDNHNDLRVGNGWHLRK